MPVTSAHTASAGHSDVPVTAGQAASRREFLAAAVATGLAAGSLAASAAPSRAAVQPAAAQSMPIVDTHQHLWDLQQFQLPWLTGAPEILNRSYGLADYAAATAGLNVVQAVYMEVDVQPDQQQKEADTLLAICKAGQSPTVAAVISGRPDSGGFANYIRAFRDVPQIRGVRQVLHAPSAERGLCLRPQFVASMRLLGELGMSFDLCMRPGELADAVQLVRTCPETQFILNHCGNAAPAAFLPPAQRPAGATHDPQQWKREILELAECPNVVCKISGVIASKPPAVPAVDALAPIINHCLDAFGPDRVVFGGDWPVCLLGGTFREWVTTLQTIVAQRSQLHQEQLWFRNARRIYRLPA